MPDVVYDPAEVRIDFATLDIGVVDNAVLPGEVVSYNEVTGEWQHPSVLLFSRVIAVPVGTAARHQHAPLVLHGSEVDFGDDVFVPGHFYSVSDTGAGKIRPYDELESPELLMIVGYALTTRVLKLHVIPTGITTPLPVGGGLLLEQGGFLVLEQGGFLILEG